MAELNEHVAYLSQEIGPRPAGTEEEQRAALYISEQFSAEAGLTTAMEDFQCNPDSSLPRTLCSGVAVLVTLVATIVGALAVPAIVVSLICAALAAAEVFDKPVLSRLLNRGVSQNVVARYLPAKSPTRASRRRKVIVVANYDSGKVRRDLNGAMPAVLPILYWVELAMLVVMPLLLAIRMMLAPDGTVLVVFNVLLAVAMVIAVLPVASFLLEKFANYNEGANCNAAGVAVLLEVSRRCRSGSPRCARANGSWRGGRRVGGTCSRGCGDCLPYGEYFRGFGNLHGVGRRAPGGRQSCRSGVVGETGVCNAC